MLKCQFPFLSANATDTILFLGHEVSSEGLEFQKIKRIHL